MIKKLPGWVTFISTLASLPESMQWQIRKVIQEELENQREQLAAQAMGMTVEQYRIWVSIPMDVTPSLSMFGKDHNAETQT